MSKATVWVIIMLVVGLVLGFFGGYYYKNLSAQETPLSSDRISIKKSTLSIDTKRVPLEFFTPLPGNEVNGELASDLMTTIGQSIIAQIRDLGGGDISKGLEKFVGKENLAQSMQIQIPLSKIFGLGTARAQTIGDVVDDFGKTIGVPGLGDKIKGPTPACSQEQLGLLETKIKDWFKNYFDDTFKDNPCLEKVDLNATIWLMVHQKTEGLKTITFIEFAVKSGSKFTLFYWEKEGSECKNKSNDYQISFKGGIRITEEPGKGATIEFVKDNNPGSGYKKVCQKDKYPITATYNNPKFNKEECCKEQPQKEESPVPKTSPSPNTTRVVQ